MNLYLVSVQVFCESPQEAVRRTIIPGSVEHVKVSDWQGELGGQGVKIPVLQAQLKQVEEQDETALPLD